MLQDRLKIALARLLPAPIRSMLCPTASLIRPIRESIHFVYKAPGRELLLLPSCCVPGAGRHLPCRVLNDSNKQVRTKDQSGQDLGFRGLGQGPETLCKQISGWLSMSASQMSLHHALVRHERSLGPAGGHRLQVRRLWKTRGV